MFLHELLSLTFLGLENMSEIKERDRLVLNALGNIKTFKLTDKKILNLVVRVDVEHALLSETVELNDVCAEMAC